MNGVIKRNSVFIDQNGHTILEKKQLPSIYLFKLPQFNRQIGKTCTKVGYTVQRPLARTGQWTAMGGIYKDLIHLADIPAYFVNEDGDPVYFMDHAVHRLLESDSYKKIVTLKSVIAQFTDEHISQELFYNTEDDQRQITEEDLVNTYVPMLKNIYENKMYSGFKFYKDFRESAVENSIHFAPKDDFGLRGFQENFVAEALSYFTKHYGTGNVSKYLLSAPTRSGKSFMSASLASRVADCLSSMGKTQNLVLVVSGIADVGVEWQETFEGHKAFNQKNTEGKGATKFAFITRNELLQNGAEAVQDAYDNGAENVVVFLTLQDLNGSFTDKKGENFKAHDFLKVDESGKSPVDFMIVDEAHFAAFNRHGEYSSMIARADIKKTDEDEDVNMSQEEFEIAAKEFQSIQPTVGTLYVSATPYNELIGGDSFSVYSKNMTIISKQDITNEASAWNLENPEAEEWESPYYGLPTVYSFAVDVGTQISNILEVDEKNGTFVNEESAHSLIWNFFGFKYSYDYLYPIVVSDPVYQNSGMGNHLIITVPSCLAADAVEESLGELKKRYNEKFNYKVMNVSSDNSSHIYRKKKALDIKREISELDQRGEKTVVITVDRLTTGVTVKEWDTVVFWREMSSAQKFDQFKGRNGTPFVIAMVDDEGGKIKRIEKQNVAVISYAPEQMLNITYETAHTMARVKQDEENFKKIEESDAASVDEDSDFDSLSTLEIIEEELKVSPTYVFSGGDHMVKVNAKNILNEVLKAQKNLGPRDYATKVNLDLSNVVSDAALMAQLSQISADESKLSMSISAFEDEPIPEGMCQFVKGCEKPVVDTLDNYSGLYCKKHLYLKASIDEESPKHIPEKGKKAEGLKDALSDEEVNEAELEKQNLTQRIINLISVVLMFVALSKDDEESLKDVVKNLEDENNHNAHRIAKHLGIDLPLLKALQKKQTFNYTLDNQIFLINSNFEHIDEKSSLDEVWDAMTILINGFGRFSSNEIPTPSKVAELVVDKLELSERDYKTFANNGVSVMDNGCKSAVMLVEFARRALANGVDSSKLHMSAVPTSPATYELIRKVYELLGWDINNIYHSDFVNNLDTVRLMEMAVERTYGCQRDNVDDCPFHGGSKVAAKTRTAELKVTNLSFPKKRKKMADEEFEALVSTYPDMVMDKVLENIFGKIIDENDLVMAKEFWEKIVKDVQKFDFVISNPPYQQLLSGATVLNIYPGFILNGSIIANKSIMVHPARAFRGAGRFVKEHVEEILDNPHFSVEYKTNDGSILFPGTDIKGGVIITKFDPATLQNGFSDLIEEELANICFKVESQIGFKSILDSIYSYGDNRISDLAREELFEEMKNAPNKSHFKTNIFDTIPELFENEPTDEIDKYGIIGFSKTRKIKYIPKKYVFMSDKWENKWKVFLPGSSGSLGGKIGKPYVGNGMFLCTQTFIAFGMFETEEEANNCSKYLITRFARAILSKLKVTQHNAKGTWLHVPVQDFTVNSDIDWTKSIDEIDHQLYKKYSLTAEEIHWIKNNIQENA